MMPTPTHPLCGEYFESAYIVQTAPCPDGWCVISDWSGCFPGHVLIRRVRPDVVHAFSRAVDRMVHDAEAKT